MNVATAPWEIAEQALLRMVLRDGSLLDKVSLEPEQMSRLSHAAIWRACRHLRSAGRPVVADAVQVVLATAFQDEPSTLEAARGYVERLYSRVVSTDLDVALEHAATVREYARIRLVGSHLDALGRLVQAHDRRVLDSVADLAAQVSGASGTAQYQDWRTSTDDTLSDLQARQEGRLPPALRVGVHSLDDLQVFLPGEYIILGARTSVGKSALALRMATEIADAQRPVLYVSMEMRDRQLVKRALAAHSGVPSLKLRTARLDDLDWGALHTEAARQHGWPIFTMDRKRRDMETISMAARQIKVRHGLALIVVDYIQRLHFDVPRGGSRREAIMSISGQLKDLAGELECAVLALAQINREGNSLDTGRRPHLSDLAECGNLEQDCDAALLLSPNLRGRPYEQWREDEPRSVLMDLAKSRDGIQKDVYLHFWPNRVHFEEAAEQQGAVV